MLPAVHTMAELKLSGNHLKGSRAVVSFDAGFEAQPHLQLLKEMLTQVFATPRQHQRVKPFFDHVISFHWADSRVWLRNYQVRWFASRSRAAWCCTGPDRADVPLLLAGTMLHSATDRPVAPFPSS